jgi:hypothetical protein
MPVTRSLNPAPVRLHLQRVAIGELSNEYVPCVGAACQTLHEQQQTFEVHGL